MKLLIENFKNFLHENDDPAFEKLRRLLLGGQALQAFELAGSIDEKLLRSVLLEYAKIWSEYSNSENWQSTGIVWLDDFLDGHRGKEISEYNEMLKKIEEILNVHDEYYDDDELTDIYNLQHHIRTRIRTLKLFPNLFN